MIKSYQVSESLNNSFAVVMINLNIPQYEYPTVNTSGIDDPIIRALENTKTTLVLNYSKLTMETRMTLFVSRKFKQLKLNLDCSKGSLDSNISTKITKKNMTYLCQFYLQKLVTH